MKKSKGSAAIVVVIIVLVVLLLGAAGAAGYFWWKSENVELAVVATMTAAPTTTVVPTTVSPTPTGAVTKTPTTTPTATTTPTTTSSAVALDQTPTKVVESFMNATLGTLPGAKIDYDLARGYMTEALKVQYSGEVWVPQFYGIQDGPTSVKFISQSVVGDTAYVRFDAVWGTMSLGWMFTLEKVGDTWLISGFNNDAQ